MGVGIPQNFDVEMRWINGFGPGATTVGGTNVVAAVENRAGIVLEKRGLEGSDAVSAKKRPAVTEAEEFAATELKQTRVLRAAERVSVDESRSDGPSGAGVAGADGYELTVGIDVVVFPFTEGEAIGGAPECDDEFTIGTTNDGRESAVIKWVRVEDEVADFFGGSGGERGRHNKEGKEDAGHKWR